jgi:hypothetical protein
MTGCASTWPGPPPEDLRRQIDARKSFEADLIARLVEHCTWAALDVPHAERQALAGWQQIIARIGKGTGKRVPLLKRQAQELMSQARRAVPVWIMPLGRVIENFSPDELLRRAEELLQRTADVTLEVSAESEAPEPAPPLAPSGVEPPSAAPRLESPAEAARIILEFLTHNPGWHGRQEIVTATTLADEWRDAITQLLARGLVVKRGAKRGTQYRAAASSRPAPPGHGQQQALAPEPRAGEATGPAPVADEHAVDDTRRALIRFRESVVRPAFPDVPAERGLLRRAMLEALLRHRPTSLAEYERRIPDSLRQYTDPRPLHHLPEVFTILSRLPRT